MDWFLFSLIFYLQLLSISKLIWFRMKGWLRRFKAQRECFKIWSVILLLMVGLRQGVMFQLTKPITQSQLSLLIQYQSQLLSPMETLETLNQRIKTSDGLKPLTFLTITLIIQKISLPPHLESKQSNWFSTMLQSEEKKMIKLMFKRVMLNKQKHHFHHSLEMQLTPPIEKLGGARIKCLDT